MSIENVYKQIKFFVDKIKVNYLFFWSDNLLIYPTRQIEEFCEMYSEFKLPFFCQSHPSTLNDKKLRLLAKAGLERIGVGIEHGNEEFRRKVVNRNYSNKCVLENFPKVKKYDIALNTNNILGFPLETPELAMETVELNKAVEPDTANCSIFTPFWGTKLRDLALQKGYLKDKNFFAPTNSENSSLEMPQFTKSQIEGKRRTFELYIKFPKNRWKEIALAEEISPEGDRIWENLGEEFREKYW